MIARVQALIPKPPVSRQFYEEFVLANPDLRIERTAGGEVVVMPPAHSRIGNQNIHLTGQLANWAAQDKTGVAFDSSTGFDLPNGSNRSPDAAWVTKSRLRDLTDDQKEGYLPLCPDFVAEIRSKNDRLNTLQAKMQEYIDNGARLGWLIDPAQRRVYVYRAGSGVEIIENPEQVRADPEMPGFSLDLANIWNPDL